MKNLGVWLSLLISFLLFLYLAFLDFAAFDAANHLLFAKHYRNSWFSLIEQHVGGGLDLSTYSPLAYQIIAALSFVFPLKASYYILLLVSLWALSYFSSKFFIDYLETTESKLWLTFLFIFFSTGILVTIFVFGQITTIVGLSFGFISLYYFNRFLVGGESRNAILSSLSLSLSAFSHNLSFLIIAIFYFFIIAFEHRTILKRLNRFALFLIILLVLVTIIYYPLISKSFINALIPQKEIAHWSRYPFISSINYERWFSMYGLSIFMLASPILFVLSEAKNRKNFLKLYFIAIFFFLLGLGRATPLTKIFGGLEYWLTYERFSLASSIILVALFALFIPRMSIMRISYKKHEINLLPIIFLILFVSINFDWLYHTHTLFFGHPVKHADINRQEITNYVLNFLNNVSSNNTSNYRYQTFGYGRPIGELYLYSKLPTLDTDYFTGRTVDWLRSSGIDEIDQSRDKNFLDMFMNNTSEYSVKYIITFNDFYHQYIKLYNWKLVESKSFNGKSIIIWENPNELKEVSPLKDNISLLNYFWGILPITTLLAFLILLSKYELKVLK